MESDNYQWYRQAQVPEGMRAWADEWIEAQVLAYRLGTVKDIGGGLSVLPPVNIQRGSRTWIRFGEPPQYVAWAYLED